MCLGTCMLFSLRTLILRNTSSLDGDGYDVAIIVLWPGQFGLGLHSALYVNDWLKSI